MKLAVPKPIPVACACVLGLALVACAGKEVLDLGGDAAPDDAGGVDDGGDDYTPPTPAGTLPCGPSVCTSPEVCCEQFQQVWQCEPADQCNEVAIACDALSCPARSTCCVAVEDQDVPATGYDGRLATGSSQCVDGTMCPAGTQVACVDTCPSEDDICAGFIAARCTPLDPELDPDGGFEDAGGP